MEFMGKNNLARIDDWCYDEDDVDMEEDFVIHVNPVLQANLTKEQQKQLIAQMLTEVPLIDGWEVD